MNKGKLQQSSIVLWGTSVQANYRRGCNAVGTFSPSDTNTTSAAGVPCPKCGTVPNGLGSCVGGGWGVSRVSDGSSCM